MPRPTAELNLDATRMCALDTRDGKVWVPFKLKRSRRSRSIRVSIGHGSAHVLLTVPMRAREADAMTFLCSQGDWVVEHLRECKPPEKLMNYFKRQPWLSAYGERVPLRLAFGMNRPSVQPEPGGGRLVLRFDPRDRVEGQLKAALREFARDVLKARTLELALSREIPVGRVTVRDQNTVWGSCSEGRNISLNWRLLLLPVCLQDYIILHELAHVTHMNHSSDFWDLLGAYDSRAILHDRRITQVTPQIMSLGR